MKYAYIVHGSTGEYSDRCDWDVAVYLDESEAQKHVEALNSALKSINQRTSSSLASYDERREFKSPLDPDCQIDYTGVRYGVVKIMLPENVAEFLAESIFGVK